MAMTPKQLRTWRDRRELSQSATADLLCVSLRTIQYYERPPARLELVPAPLAFSVCWRELEHIYPQIADEIRARLIGQKEG